MVELSEDPREVAWHPRFAPQIIGHEAAQAHFSQSLAAEKLHHAWLMTGPKGIGKASLAYQFAGQVLGQKNRAQSERWIAARAHPDLFVLERQLNDSKPRKLKAEISVENARGLSEFFSHTSSGSWRVGIVDAADDLSSESANALLKLVEEPPANCLLLLVCHNPGRLLRTMKSRCTRLALKGISQAQVRDVVTALPLEKPAEEAALDMAARLSAGSPGRALQLLSSDGARAFDAYLKTNKWNSGTIAGLAAKFGARAATIDDFNLFADLLLNWVAEQAAAKAHAKLAVAHAKIAENIRLTNAFNLDRRQAVIAAISLVNDALKAA
jgi:DNA polymerase III subunit delta'